MVFSVTPMRVHDECGVRKVCDGKRWRMEMEKMHILVQACTAVILQSILEQVYARKYPYMCCSKWILSGTMSGCVFS